MGIAVTRSVWSASSSLALSLSVAAAKAGASSTHSKRFAREDVRTAPQYATGLTFQSNQGGETPALFWIACAEHPRHVAVASAELFEEFRLAVTIQW
jgi:hypothetical protein